MAMLILALNAGFPEVAGLMLQLLQNEAVPPDWNTFLAELETGILRYAGDGEGREGYQLPPWLPEKTAKKFDLEAFMNMRGAFDEYIR